MGVGRAVAHFIHRGNPMPVATPPPPIHQPEVIASEMERLLNENADDNWPAHGLRPHVRFLPNERRANGSLVFEISVTGEGYGGPMAVKKEVSLDRLSDWRSTEGAFLTGKSDVLRSLQRRMDAERKARAEEEE